MKTSKPPNPKINKAKQKERRSAHKRTWGLFYVCQIPLSMKTTLECVETHNGTPLQETVSSFSQQVSITNNFLDWGEILCLLPLLSARTPPSPQFFCVLSQSVSSYVINHVVSGRSSFSGAIQHLWLLESFPFLICIDPWALIGEVWCEHPFFRQSKSTLLTNESGQGPSYQAAV